MYFEGCKLLSVGHNPIQQDLFLPLDLGSRGRWIEKETTLLIQYKRGHFYVTRFVGSGSVP